MRKVLVLVIIFFLVKTAFAGELYIDYKGNKVVIEKNGVVKEIEIDKKLLTEGDSDAIVDYVMKKLKESK